MTLSLSLQKAREKKEGEIRVAIEHQTLMRNNMNIYKKTAIGVVQRYEKWCKRNSVEPTLNMQEIYKEVNQ